MYEATAKDEKTKDDGSQAWSVSSIVVASPSPLWEAIVEVEIIALPPRTFEDVGYNTQASVPLLGKFNMLVNLILSWWLVHVDFWFFAAGELWFVRFLCAGGNESLLDLVGVEDARFLPQGFPNFFLGRGGFDAEKIYTGALLANMQLFIADSHSVMNTHRRK